MPNLSQLPSLNPSTTHITNVLILNSEQHIRPLSPSEIGNLKKWMDADRRYDARMRNMKGQMNEEFKDLQAGVKCTRNALWTTAREVAEYVCTELVGAWWVGKHGIKLESV